VRNPEPKIDSKGRVAIMDGILRNPYLENHARGRIESVCLLHGQTMWSINNHQSQKKQNAIMTRVTGSRGV
jgi:hypothetical protein